MTCEYSQVSNDNQGVACKTSVALPEAKVQIGLEGLTVAEIKEILCKSCDQSECPAYQDLKARGRGSRYCK